MALAKRVVVDHRSDIYSLGVTLYELLTLQPAYTGEDRQELLRQIAFDEPRRPRQISRSIPADLETIILKAQEKNPKDRYATAQELADDLRRFVAMEPIKARSPSLLNRTAKWSRRHRSLVWALTATLLVSGLILAASLGWIVRDREARRLVTEKVARHALDEAARMIGQSNWSAAMTAVNRAEDVLAIGEYEGAQRQRARELHKDIDIATRLEELRVGEGDMMGGVWTLMKPINRPHFRPSVGPAYEKIFREYGIDIDTMDPPLAAHQIREQSIVRELAAALDDWAAWRESGADNGWRRVDEVARILDPDPWHNRLRDMLREPPDERKAALVELATSATDDLDARSVVRLAEMLDDSAASREAIAILRTVLERYPGDYHLNRLMGRCLKSQFDDPAVRKTDPSVIDEALGYYRTARPSAWGSTTPTFMQNSQVRFWKKVCWTTLPQNIAWPFE